MTIAILDNIRSAHNVGSIFRTADAFGISEVYLCGTTPTPVDKFGRTRRDIEKVALGAEKTMPWKYFSSTLRAVNSSKRKGIKIFSIEQNEKSEDISKLNNYKNFDIALVFGNEVEGISQKVLKNSDKIFEIPMFGKKESLNVSVAFGIAVYNIRK
ncbi:MAG: TrmH family RNA methyltransferase [Parcubacteria group bacterium]